MDPITLLLTALAAGAAAGAQGTASQAVKDGYAGLKALILKRFAGRQAAETALVEYEKDEETWKKPLQKSLAEVGADRDEDILQQAQHLLKQINPQQASQGKYNINIGEAKGNAIGDNARVENTWSD
jgi:Effector-associated domain 10